MELEIHQLTRRYERLRKRHPKQEEALLASIAKTGQQQPVVVVADAVRWILIDGYKRLRALELLGRDTVQAIKWELDEVHALLFERSLRQGSEDFLDQAWLMVEIQERFNWSLTDLARGFQHSTSWVSRRMALVTVLPEKIQDQVRMGSLSAYAAMKYLVPLARANAEEAEQFSKAIASISPTTRDIGLLYDGWRRGTKENRELIINSPHIFLQAKKTAEPPPPSEKETFIQGLDSIAAISRRSYKELKEGLLQKLFATERQEVRRAVERATADFTKLTDRMKLENID